MEEWIGRLRTAAVKCNYQEIDRQLNEQFIHILNDNEILAEIIKELTKCDENMTILSENVLNWAKRIEAQRAQMAVINSTLDAIMHTDDRKRENRPTTSVTLGERRRYKCCNQAHKLR